MGQTHRYENGFHIVCSTTVPQASPQSLPRPQCCISGLSRRKTFLDGNEGFIPPYRPGSWKYIRTLPCFICSVKFPPSGGGRGLVRVCKICCKVLLDVLCEFLAFGSGLDCCGSGLVSKTGRNSHVRRHYFGRAMQGLLHAYAVGKLLVGEGREMMDI